MIHHRYRIGSAPELTFLIMKLYLSHGISELHFCSRGTNTYDHILDIVKSEHGTSVGFFCGRSLLTETL